MDSPSAYGRGACAGLRASPDGSTLPFEHRLATIGQPRTTVGQDFPAYGVPYMYWRAWASAACTPTFGHVLGIDEQSSSYNGTSIMYEFVNKGTANVGVQAADAQALQYMYGTP